jgi:hypothetical protein
MQDIMVACQEISKDDLDAYRSRGIVPPGKALGEPSDAGAETKEGQVEEHDAEHGEVTEALIQALSWSTGVKDRGLLVALAAELPVVLREEQVRKYARAKREDPLEKKLQVKNLLVNAQHVASRMQVAKKYYEHLRSCGWKEGEREPWGARRAFLRRVQWGAAVQLRRKTEALGRWLRVFLEKNKGSIGSTNLLRRKETPRSKPWHERSRGEGGGRPRHCDFEWWSWD